MLPLKKQKKIWILSNLPNIPVQDVQLFLLCHEQTEEKSDRLLINYFISWEFEFRVNKFSCNENLMDFILSDTTTETRLAEMKQNLGFGMEIIQLSGYTEDEKISIAAKRLY